MKYDFVEIYRIVNGKHLKRIRALKDIPVWGVKKGDLGGYVESEHNLDQETDSWIMGFSYVMGDRKVSGRMFIYDSNEKGES